MFRLLAVCSVFSVPFVINYSNVFEEYVVYVLYFL